MKPILTKTQHRGLYITADGKAWRNDLKIEIKPNTNGKIRFKGKLYDLQKIIDYSYQKNAKKKRVNNKKPKPTKEPLRELERQGFKKTQINGLYLSKAGKAYNNITKRHITPTAYGTVIINGKGYNFAKLILETFSKIPVRSGQINFKNGNTKDYTIDNLEYKSTEKQPPPNPTDLIKCIRFYFEVDKNLKSKSPITKYYLYEIIKKRGFNLKFKGLDFDLFLEYTKTDFWVFPKNQNNTFEKFNYTVTNGKNAINKYLNLLVNECMQDFENGLLQIKDFKPKPPTKTDTLRALQKKADEYGLNIKIPLRKKSTKELLNDYKKNTKKIDLEIEALRKEPQ
ncbi:hypothetical protein BWK63_05025 [Flavobacterium covae]|uniref:hypothetical protein n=1 Tax=Flavobacterium covae TaxID=2906076 RepID=UPI000B4CD5E4|nr:hypothetical protein [Flavobacterium covae]OWP81649.1 hypothetical protein BWK63_05025 [Flavobacterium covae]